jgi:hypothetical protein
MVLDDNLVTENCFQGAERRPFRTRFAEYLRRQQFGAARTNESDPAATFIRSHHKLCCHIL